MDSGAKSNIDPSSLWFFCESQQPLSFLLCAGNLGLEEVFARRERTVYSEEGEWPVVSKSLCYAPLAPWCSWNKT